MPSAGFEPTIPAIERPQTALETAWQPGSVLITLPSLFTFNHTVSERQPGTAREKFRICSLSLFCLHFILSLSLSNLGVKALIYGNNQCVLPAVSRQIHTKPSP